ncbi:MAG: tRNA pseudouridine(38-40) synthase TruA [Clostridiales bacterium]|jgi:tRNA pseudouridine38-40 synthase|nr:tRNA pseudouridine(38-40) synthase TruA [Clostridiales bacterium]
MKKFLLTLEYDGTAYAGWQSQKNATTIQGTLEQSLSKLITGGKDHIHVEGCSRTDAGVHALGYKAVFMAETSIPGDKICYAINSFLPKDITARSSEEVDPDFHPRHDVISKIYRYVILNRVFSSPVLKNRAWLVRKTLDTQKMSEAASYYTGTHDFSAFMAAGGYSKNFTRTILRSEISCSVFSGDPLITFEIEGDGFLYNMVRIMAGTLVYAGLGKIEPVNIPEIIDGKNRNDAGLTAPAQGLYLYDVHFLNKKASS